MRFICLLLALFLTGAVHAQDPGFTSSDVADAAEELTGRRAHMSEEIRLLSGTRLAGPAITLRVVRDDTASSLTEGLKAIKIVETAEPGSVIVVVLEDEKGFAVFGATFATLAKSRGLGGFVIDGSMRGLVDFRRLGFPMFARGMVPGSAGGHYRLEAANVTVMCGGVAVSSGDFIVGDADGVAVAPKAQYEEVLANAKKLREEKEILLPLVARYRSYTKAAQEMKARESTAKSPAHPNVSSAKQFQSYLDRKEYQAARAMMAGNPRRWFDKQEGEGSPWQIGPGKEGPWADWDREFRKKTEEIRWEADDHSATVFYRETNDYFQLLDRGWVTNKTVYLFDGAGKIYGLLVAGASDPRPPGRTQEFLNWARRDEPGELAYLMPNGEIDPSGDRPKRYRALLNRWRDAVGLGQIP